MRKVFLEDVFANVGNIIKNRALIRTNHFPELQSSSLTNDERNELIDETITLSQHWLESKHNEESLKLNNRSKKHCPYCNDDVKKQGLGENNRVTDWCLSFQCK